ncbi:MAG: PKD domain-containing protein, partial [Bacteroidota bacterium]|nr:PKD domain-containing protein [Bacteroidota bacterium]
VGPTAMADPPATTTYTITGTPLNPCYAPVTLNIVVQVTPGEGNDPVIQPVPPICVTSSPIALVVDSLGGVWSGPGITNASLGTFDPGTAGLGSHLIVYVTPGLCNTTDTMYITVASGLDPTVTQPPTLCIADSAIMLSGLTPGGIWSGTGIIDSVSGTFDPDTSGAGIHIITYTVNGTCTSNDTVAVEVVTSFNPTITPQPDVCVGSPIFNFTAATGGGVWTGTGISGPITGAYNPSTAGTFPIIYSIPGFCASSDTINMTVVPYADATITAVPPVCQGTAPFNFAAADTGGTWSGTGITNPALGTYSPLSSGNFIVTYTISGLCGDSDTQTITVNPAPAPAITADITSGCMPVCVDFDESAGPTCTNVIYNFGDGISDSIFSPVHCYTSAGIYSVSITCTDANNCSGTTLYTNMITVWPIPEASFSVSPSTLVDPNSPVTFADLSTDAGFSFWNFGDPTTLNDTSTSGVASYSYSLEDEYCITLIASNGGGCLDTATRCIIVVGEGLIFIPNVFSPNG